MVKMRVMEESKFQLNNPANCYNEKKIKFSNNQEKNVGISTTFQQYQ